MDQVTILGVVRPVLAAAASAGAASIAITPAVDMLVVGSPDPARALQRIASTRSWAPSRLIAACLDADNHCQSTQFT
jgi:hypothetical protein